MNDTLPEDTGNYSNATEETDAIKPSINTSAPAANSTIINSTPAIYFAFVVAVGATGFVANALVFNLICFQRNPGKNMCNALIHNQTAIDFSASISLLIMYTVKLHGIQLTGSWGRFYCKLFDSNAMYSWGISASTAGLMVISVERYAKIVHSVPYRVRFRPWMKYVGMVFPWIYSVLISFPILMLTSEISNGRCLAL